MESKASPVTESKASPPVTQGQGFQAPTPQDTNHSHIHPPQATTPVPNPPSGAPGTPAPATSLPVGQTHPSMTSGMTASVQPAAAVGRVVQPALTLAAIMPASSGQPQRLAPGAPIGQPQRPPGGPSGVQVGRGARTSAVAPQLAVRPPQPFLTPGGIPGIPPGHTLMRTETGHMILVPHNYLAQLQANKGQTTVPNIHPRPATPTAMRPPPAYHQPIHVGPLIHPVPGGMAGRNPIGVTAQANQKLSDPGGGGGGTFRDDDINDVASMAGVNLNEENAQILATSSEHVGTKIRSCKDENFLATGPLHRRILQIARTFGVSEVPAEVVNFVSQATQWRLSALLEKVSAAARHRANGGGAGADAEGGPYERSSDVRAQLGFFKQLESMEKQRKHEQEREILLKAAKSRARQEDPEQACLKQKAREIQQQELALIQQHDANRAALDAIGPRKKRKLDSPLEASSSSAADSEVPAGARDQWSSAAVASCPKPRKQVTTRVTLSDFIFCVQQERPRSLLLYKALLGKAEKC